MASSSDVDLAADRFDISGPAHMMAENGAGSSPMVIHWGKEEHRRCVAACLVKGVTVMVMDRSRRGRTDPLAPAWWESFGFRRLDVIKDDPDEIFGAIYEYKPRDGVPRHPLAPRYVVAFRGTIRTHLGDLRQDIRIINTTFRDSKRSEIARKAVDDLLDGCITVGNDDASASCIVWLAGHSLGASQALDVGRFMMSEKRLNLPTFLFNPPQVSLAPVINLLRPTEKAKKDLYTTIHCMKAVLGLPFYFHKKRMEKLFERLSPWEPELYVHEKDPICKGYIDYFEQRQQMAMMLSCRGMLLSLIGDEKETQHLLPSARLWKKSSMAGDVDGLQQQLCDLPRDVHRLKKLVGKAHSLEQWWKSDSELSLNCTQYKYRSA
ncbi:hypothetical protein E2562_003880 [Oryza meyeriana var. granulata]|uniref:Fungal lipase-like domain-containing protein n=1 Tax=Oryza meyeriana var. granulata TaxID=110450 RepID=A0A6G1CYS7_9ORYZ|nr:hypothetical protein E2562_003880 [Oryza meyeriana var. granulata]